MMLSAYRRHLLAAGRAHSTVRLYTLHLDVIERECGPLVSLTIDDLERFLALRRDLSSETRKSYRTAMQSFYRWAAAKGYVMLDPAAELLPIRVNVAPARVAEDALVRSALNHPDERIRLMVMLGRFCCLRLEEFTTLHSDHRHGDLLRIVGKGEKVRLVPLMQPVLDMLLRIERRNGPGYYFPGRFGGHLHKESVSKMIRREVGVNPHSLRHAGATAAYERTNDIRGVQEMLGHSSVATTQRYVHTDLDAIRRVAAAAMLDPAPPRPPLRAVG